VNYGVCRSSQIILTASAASVTGGSVSPGPAPVPVPRPNGGSTVASKKAMLPGCEEVDCETRIQRLEERWEELNNLPTNSEMFRRLRKFKEIEESPTINSGRAAGSNMDVIMPQQTLPCPGMPRTCHPMSELWHAMQLLNQVETNTEGITRVRTVLLCCTLCVLPTQPK